MKTLFFEGEITTEKVIAFADKLHLASKEAEEVQLSFVSEGGEYSTTLLLAKMLESYPYKLEILCSWTVASSAVTLLYNITKPIVFLPTCYGAIHKLGRPVHTRDLLDKESTENFLIREQSKENKLIEHLVFPNLSSKERIEYNKGWIVLLSQERLSRLVHDARARLLTL